MSEPTSLIEIGEEDKDFLGFHPAVIRCSEKDYTVFTSYRSTYGDPQGYADRVLRDHLEQHKPGRAMDIEVSWEPSACCSVCEDSIGNVVQEDDGLTCRDCGTTWDIDGEQGERMEDHR